MKKFPAPHHLIIVFIFLTSTFLCANCRRRCYSCNTKDSGETCLNNPENVTEATVPCKFYCTIKRVEYGYGEGSSPSIALNRSCERHPVHLNGVTQDIYFITYYRACRENLCNSGDGLERNARNLTEDGVEEDELLDLQGSSGSVSKPFVWFLSIYYYSIMLIFM